MILSTKSLFHQGGSLVKLTMAKMQTLCPLSELHIFHAHRWNHDDFRCNRILSDCHLSLTSCLSTCDIMIKKDRKLLQMHLRFLWPPRGSPCLLCRNCLLWFYPIIIDRRRLVGDLTWRFPAWDMESDSLAPFTTHPIIMSHGARHHGRLQRKKLS